MPIDHPRARRAVEELLRALGHDPDSEPEFRETPEHVVAAFERDLLVGREVDLAALLSAEDGVTDDGTDGIVVVKDIEVTTMCPHHLMPAQGKAVVAYLPGSRVLGLGRIPRLVDACARRLTFQEQIGKQVVHALMVHAGASGAFCRLSLVHSCMTARGSRQAGSSVHTVASAGALSGTEGHTRVMVALGCGTHS